MYHELFFGPRREIGSETPAFHRFGTNRGGAVWGTAVPENQNESSVKTGPVQKFATFSSKMPSYRLESKIDSGIKIHL